MTAKAWTQIKRRIQSGKQPLAWVERAGLVHSLFVAGVIVQSTESNKRIARLHTLAQAIETSLRALLAEPNER